MRIEEEPVAEPIRIDPLPDVSHLELENPEPLEQKIEEEIAMEEENIERMNNRSGNATQEAEEDQSSEHAQTLKMDSNQVKEEIRILFGQYPELMSEAKHITSLIQLESMDPDRAVTLLLWLRMRISTKMAKTIGDAGVHGACQMACYKGKISLENLEEDVFKDADFMNGVHYFMGRLLGYLPYSLRLVAVFFCHCLENYGKPRRKKHVGASDRVQELPTTPANSGSTPSYSTSYANTGRDAQAPRVLDLTEARSFTSSIFREAGG